MSFIVGLPTKMDNYVRVTVFVNPRLRAFILARGHSIPAIGGALRVEFPAELSKNRPTEQLDRAARDKRRNLRAPMAAVRREQIHGITPHPPASATAPAKGSSTSAPPPPPPGNPTPPPPPPAEATNSAAAPAPAAEASVNDVDAEIADLLGEGEDEEEQHGAKDAEIMDTE